MSSPYVPSLAGCRAGWKARFLVGACIAASSGACAPHHATDASRRPTHVPSAPADQVGMTPSEIEVLRVYSGDDPGVMASMGEQLEKDRPPLTPTLIEAMLPVLRGKKSDDMMVNMMRPMLFRTIALIVGPPARPLLEGCAAEGDRAAEVCRDATAEISRSHPG